jgi:hypothetical protein
MALALPGSALADSAPPPAADDTRFNLSARADAFYFQVDGDEIPTSPKNDSGSATAAVSTNNSGGSKAFAGAPFYGNTVQTLPGTINGVSGSAVQIPFSRFPGYVEANSAASQNKVAEEGNYYRVSAEALPTTGDSSAYYGAPSTFPAPNQQQTAIAHTKTEGANVLASAFGSSEGVVTGPLEIADSAALATISQTAGQEPKIESKTFGRFSVSGQEFGFDQSGFKYLGQGMSSKDAIDQANAVLKASNIQLALAPAVQEKIPSGGTRYTIGGLMVTTTQASPSGGGNFTFTYVVGRASISADVAELGLSASSGTERAGTDAGIVSGFKTDSSRSSPASGTATADPRIDPIVPTRLAHEAAVTPTAVSTTNPAGQIESTRTQPAARASTRAVQPTSDEEVRTLGYVLVARTQSDTSDLYYVLALAGLGLVALPFLFSRFAGGGERLRQPADDPSTVPVTARPPRQRATCVSNRTSVGFPRRTDR